MARPPRTPKEMDCGDDEHPLTIIALVVGSAVLALVLGRLLAVFLLPPPPGS